MREAENSLSFPLTVLPLNSIIIDPLGLCVKLLLQQVPRQVLPLLLLLVQEVLEVLRPFVQDIQLLLGLSKIILFFLKLSPEVDQVQSAVLVSVAEDL